MTADIALLYTHGDRIEDIDAIMDLAYDGQTGNFAVGLVVTGGTSGATAVIVADDDQGAAGTLTLRRIRGVFQNNEAITDSATGAATVDGVLITPTIVAGADQVLALIDPDNLSKSEVMDALRMMAMKVANMDFPAFSASNQG